MRGLTTLPNESRRSPGARRKRLKLIIAYNGAPFRGWQSQANADTVQDRIENAFARVAGEKIRVHGAGRTDTGVHALGQCAHTDVPPTKLPADVWQNALNASLPPEIRIVRCRFVGSAFHARFSACGKVYRYRIGTLPVLSPFEIDRAWHLAGPLNDATLRACAAAFVGTHDFAGFAANRGRAPTSTTRTIRSVRVRRTASTTVIEFDGDGFLYKMVRLMVGAIIRCAQAKENLAEVQHRLEEPGSEGARLVAPAAGLTLVRVRY